MNGRPLTGAVDRPFGARMTPAEFAAVVLQAPPAAGLAPSTPERDQHATRDPSDVPRLVRIALAAAEGHA